MLLRSSTPSNHHTMQHQLFLPSLGCHLAPSFPRNSPPMFQHWELSIPYTIMFIRPNCQPLPPTLNLDACALRNQSLHGRFNLIYMSYLTYPSLETSVQLTGARRTKALRMISTNSGTDCPRKKRRYVESANIVLYLKIKLSFRDTKLFRRSVPSRRRHLLNHLNYFSRRCACRLCGIEFKLVALSSK